MTKEIDLSSLRQGDVCVMSDDSIRPVAQIRCVKTIRPNKIRIYYVIKWGKLPFSQAIPEEAQVYDAQGKGEGEPYIINFIPKGSLFADTVLPVDEPKVDWIGWLIGTIIVIVTLVFAVLLLVHRP